jgi:hypothetical protein
MTILYRFHSALGELTRRPYSKGSQSKSETVKDTVAPGDLA